MMPLTLNKRKSAKIGKIGEQHLEVFQDNEKTILTILTTSQKLSTGIDARNVRNIVLMRTVNSMIEFKQIIGMLLKTISLAKEELENASIPNRNTQQYSLG